MSPPPISNSKKKLIYKFILVYVTKLCFLIEGLKLLRSSHIVSCCVGPVASFQDTFTDLR